MTELQKATVTKNLKPFPSKEAASAAGKKGNTTKKLRKELYRDLLQRKVAFINPDTGQTEQDTAVNAVIMAQIRTAISGNATAQENILNRLFGKPKESVELSGGTQDTTLNRIVHVMITPDGKEIAQGTYE